MAEGQSNLEDGRHKVASTSDIFVNLEKEKENFMVKHNLNPTKKIKFQVYSRSNSFKSSNTMKIARYTIFKKENRKSPYYNPLRVLYPRPSASDENVVSSSDDTVVMDFPSRSPRVANNNVKMDEGEKSPQNTDSSDGVDERDPHSLPSSVSAGDNIWDFDQILTVSSDDEENHDQLSCSSKERLKIISISNSAVSTGHDECSDCEEEGQAQEKSPACLLHPDIHEDRSVGGEDHMDQQDHDVIMDASVTSEMAAGHNDSVTNHLELASTPPFQDPVFPPPHGARSPSPTAPLTPELVVDIEEKGQESGEEGKKFYNIDHVRPILADNSLDCQTFLSKLQQLNLGGDFDQFIKFDDNWRVSQVSSEAIFKVCGNFIGTNVLETLKCNDGETFGGSDEPSRGLSLDRPKLGIFYDPEMMKHKEEVDTNKDHPECPARIQRIFKVIKANGVLDRSEVRRLPRGRRLRKEESNLVHNPLDDLDG